MQRILYGLIGLCLLALPARADDRATAQPPDVNLGTDDQRAASPDHHAQVKGHYDTSHVEKSERRTAQNQGRRARPSRSELHQKTETKADGSKHVELERSSVTETPDGDVKDEMKTSSDTVRNPKGGTTTTREVTRSHDAPGVKATKKTTKETVVRDAAGNVVSRKKTSE